jgi:nucleotide-binding universal stress UspA family protein
MVSMTTVLHPTDFSPYAERAFQFAEALAETAHARLIVLHVLPRRGRAVITGNARVELTDGLGREQRLAALRRLDSTAVPVEHRLTEGEVVSEILDVAEETQADVIVMGSRGRNRLTRLARGSVADRVVCRARCSVVTVSVPAMPRAHRHFVDVDTADTDVDTALDRGIYDARTRALRSDGSIGVQTSEPLGKANP